MSKKVRLEDIAEALGVSAVTVSKALSGKEGVGSALREQIRTTAQRMGYKKKSLSCIPPDEPMPIGILISQKRKSPEHSFYWALYSFVSEVLQEKRCHNFLEIISDEHETLGILPEFIQRHQVKGVILLGKIKGTYLDALIKARVPVVLVDYYTDAPSTASVIADNFYGGYAMTKYLLEMGHRAIGYVGSIDVDANALDRYYGYCKALRQYHLFPQASWVIPDRQKSSFNEAFQLPLQMPTAFFCCCDQSAYHFTKYLRKKNIAIPEDVSVVGFYDHTFARIIEPKLTTYRIDMKVMAEKSIDVLLQIIQHTFIQIEKILVFGTLIERDSVKKIPVKFSKE